jgi:hypothetical protein
MKKAERIEHLSREELRDLLKIYARNWLAHDGCWFLSLEEKFDLRTAIEVDIESWRRFTVIEAKRLIKFLQLGENSGLQGLKKALFFRLYSCLNEDEVIVDEVKQSLEYRVKTCRVQSARRKKGLADFPCMQVGIVEYGLFAKTIDKRFKTTAVSCPPRISNENYYCIWKFKLTID